MENPIKEGVKLQVYECGGGTQLKRRGERKAKKFSEANSKIEVKKTRDEHHEGRVRIGVSEEEVFSLDCYG